MKKVRPEDLVIGQEYYDIDEPFNIEPIVLRFEKYENRAPCFSFVSGNESVYQKDNDNLIKFIGIAGFFQKD